MFTRSLQLLNSSISTSHRYASRKATKMAWLPSSKIDLSTAAPSLSTRSERAHPSYPLVLSETRIHSNQESRNRPNKEPNTKRDSNASLNNGLSSKLSVTLWSWNLMQESNETSNNGKHSSKNIWTQRHERLPNKDLNTSPNSKIKESGMLRT
jgi:hypothetical protein